MEPGKKLWKLENILLKDRYFTYICNTTIWNVYIEYISSG